MSRLSGPIWLALVRIFCLWHNMAKSLCGEKGNQSQVGSGSLITSCSREN
jgi:hypothetical protein